MKKPKSPLEHYQLEKERRAKDLPPDSELMAAAKKEYKALLEAQSTKGKGGRPRKDAVKPVVADDELEAEPKNEADAE